MRKFIRPEDILIPNSVLFREIDSPWATRRPRAPSFSQKDKDAISKYLENPTKSGVWQLTAALGADNQFATAICSELAAKFQNTKSIDITSGRRTATVSLTKEKKSELEEKVRTKLSFVNTLFCALAQLDKSRSDSIESLQDHISEYEIILELLDLKKLKKMFYSALDLFQQKLFCDRFSPIVREDETTHTKAGFMILQNVVDENREFRFISCDKNVLRTYGDFLVATGAVASYHLAPIFSPEERVFAPYFTILRLGAPFIIPDAHVKQLFDKAFSEYESKNYTNCIGSIGLIAEDYLTQVYETLYRNICPKALTLGQAYESIHSELSKRFSRNPQELKDLKPLFTRIASLSASIKTTRKRHEKELVEILRELTKLIQDDRKCFTAQLKDSSRSKSRISVFPSYLQDNITDLIRYRNAVSHKTMIPIGAYEALRSVYCLISLVMWWKQEKDAIDWNTDPDSILRGSIFRNTGIEI